MAKMWLSILQHFSCNNEGGGGEGNRAVADICTQAPFIVTRSTVVAVGYPGKCRLPRSGTW